MRVGWIQESGRSTIAGLGQNGAYAGRPNGDRTRLLRCCSADHLAERWPAEQRCARRQGYQAGRRARARGHPRLEAAWRKASAAGVFTGSFPKTDGLGVPRGLPASGGAARDAVPALAPITPGTRLKAAVTMRSLSPAEESAVIPAHS